MVECKFVIYSDVTDVTEIKIHKEECDEYKQHHKNDCENDYEWFYAPTYQNARLIASLLSSNRNLNFEDCNYCNPSNS